LTLPRFASAPGLPALPRHAPGMRIGLLGGSFNPPHAGHRLVSLTALKRLALDRVWWLVTPGNPLKDSAGLPPLAVRMATARALARHPRIDVTGFEAAIGTRHTQAALRYLLRRCRGVHFVWIMGSDNLRGFHRWRCWRAIAADVPLAIIDRPGETARAVRAKAAMALAAARLDESDAALLATARPPAWVLLHGPRSTASSTELRRQGRGLL
jgi:nicotinate-nucleotide adenylyltransferase